MDHVSTLVPGLVSVTFRALAPEEVLDLCVANGLRTIEWGADVHVPPGDERRAERVRVACQAAAVEVCAYGSYVQLGTTTDDEVAHVLDTARALGAPAVRMWAGATGSANCPPERRGQITAALSRAAEAADARGLRVVLEFHAGTLTDTATSARRLVRDAGHEAVDLSWQPPVGLSDRQALDTLDAVLARLGTVHVFSWDERGVRLPLAARTALWTAAFVRVAATGRPHPVMLEFVRDDDPAALAEDAATLHELIAEAAVCAHRPA